MKKNIKLVYGKDEKVEKGFNLCIEGVEVNYEKINKVIEIVLKQFYFGYTYLDREDIKQELWVIVIEVMNNRDFVNLEYVKLVCKNRLINLKRRVNLESKYRFSKDDFETLEAQTCYLRYLRYGGFENMICLLERIYEIIESLDDPLEVMYLKTYLGNIGIDVFEEHAVKSTSKKGGTDFLTAHKLGFRSNKINKYVVIKNNIRKKLQKGLKEILCDIA